MRKKDLVSDNYKLKLTIDQLEDRIDKYKEICKRIRQTYGEKLLELENERLAKYHPNIIAKSIEWYPRDIDSFLRARSTDQSYDFRYIIKGEE